MATAMDTLCSQAATIEFEAISDNDTDNEKDNGEGKRIRGNPLVGIILQRGILIEMLLCIPIFILWAFSEPLLIALGQDPELSALASLLIKWTMPGLVPFMIFECLKKYLQAQGIIILSF